MEPFKRRRLEKTIICRVTLEEYDILVKLSHERQMTLSELMREGLRLLYKRFAMGEIVEVLNAD